MKTGYYKADIAGFSYQGYGIDSLQAWWSDLKARYDLSGFALKVCEAKAVKESRGTVTASYELSDIKIFEV